MARALSDDLRERVLEVEVPVALTTLDCGVGLSWDFDSDPLAASRTREVRADIPSLSKPCGVRLDAHEAFIG